MPFLYSPEEQSVIHEAGRLLRSLFGLDRLEAPVDHHPWRQLAEKGWLTASLPDIHAGDGRLTHPVLAGVMREAGRNLLGTEFVMSAFTLPHLFCLARSADDRDRLLEDHVRLGGGWLLLDGRLPSFVVRSCSNSAAFCFGPTEGLPAYQVQRTDERTLVLHRWTNFQLSRTPVAELSPIVHDVEISGSDPVSIELNRDDDSLNIDVRNFHSAALVGIAEEALELTVQYTKTRSQFGGPIGRFQAIKHLLADAYARNEVAWNSVLYASAVSGSVEERRLPSWCAAIEANVAALESVKTMAQCFGGVGYTWESPVHRFLKRSLEECQFQGGADRAAFELGTEVLSSTCSA